MDFEHLMSLTNPEEVIKESQLMLAAATDVGDKASLLISMYSSYCQLQRLQEARQVLEEMDHLDIADSEVRLNAEFCKCTFLMMEERYTEGVHLFVELLARHHETLQNPEYRHLYEDIQCRRALGLFSLSRFKEALPILQEAVLFSFDKRDDEHEVRFALAVCLDETNETEAAKREYISVVSMAVKNSFGEEALFRLAALYYRTGAVAQAKHHLEAILRDFSDVSPAVPRKVVYKTLSQTFHYLGDKTNEKLYADLAARETNTTDAYGRFWG
jgi:pentatricopeptide repeat protein